MRFLLPAVLIAACFAEPIVSRKYGESCVTGDCAMGLSCDPDTVTCKVHTNFPCKQDGSLSCSAPNACTATSLFHQPGFYCELPKVHCYRDKQCQRAFPYTMDVYDNKANATVSIPRYGCGTENLCVEVGQCETDDFSGDCEENIYWSTIAEWDLFGCRMTVKGNDQSGVCWRTPCNSSQDCRADSNGKHFPCRAYSQYEEGVNGYSGWCSTGFNGTRSCGSDADCPDAQPNCVPKCPPTIAHNCKNFVCSA